MSDTGRSETPELGDVGHFIPLPDPIPADPYDEDGYCEWCGNGRWKYHRPECVWADADDASPEPTPAHWEIVDAHRCTACGHLDTDGYHMVEHLRTHGPLPTDAARNHP